MYFKVTINILFDNVIMLFFIDIFNFVTSSKIKGEHDTFMFIYQREAGVEKA